MLTPAELAAERAASRARVARQIAAAERQTPNPYLRKHKGFGNVDGLERKPASWYDDVYMPPMDVTEVMW